MSDVQVAVGLKGITVGDVDATVGLRKVAVGLRWVTLM